MLLLKEADDLLEPRPERYEAKPGIFDEAFCLVPVLGEVWL